MHLLLFAETIQLFPDGTIFIHVAMILAMIWILNRTLFRPINRVLQMRDRNKGGHASEAKGILQNVNEKETRYTNELLDTRSKGYQLIEKAQKKAADSHTKQIVEVKTEIADNFETGRADLDKQTAEARAAIDADAERIADSIADSILKG